MDYWIFLEMGTGRRGGKKETKTAWLMPWRMIEAAEEALAPYQASIPYSREFGKGFRIGVKDNNLFAVDYFSSYKLNWASGRYYMPVGHEFGFKYQPPFTDLRTQWKPFQE